MKNKVKKELKLRKNHRQKQQKQFEYQEKVEEFTGLIFHCPNCDKVFHLHIATVEATVEVIKDEN